jgi:hypothetical protein
MYAKNMGLFFYEVSAKLNRGVIEAIINYIRLQELSGNSDEWGGIFSHE